MPSHFLRHGYTVIPLDPNHPWLAALEGLNMEMSNGYAAHTSDSTSQHWNHRNDIKVLHWDGSDGSPVFQLEFSESYLHLDTASADIDAFAAIQGFARTAQMLATNLIGKAIEAGVIEQTDVNLLRQPNSHFCVSHTPAAPDAPDVRIAPHPDGPAIVFVLNPTAGKFVGHTPEGSITFPGNALIAYAGEAFMDATLGKVGALSHSLELSPGQARTSLLSFLEPMQAKSLEPSELLMV
jgi:hypothetical protein